MTIVAFVEGALARKGGIGLMGGATNLRSTAWRGHRVLVAMGGPPSPGKQHYVAPDPESALARKEKAGSFGVVTFRASGVWAFCPSLLWRMNRFVREADFVSVHSLYSFPVLAGFLLARIHGKPYGIWPHGVWAPVQRKISARKKWLYDKLIGRRIAQSASLLFFSAEGEREEAQCLGLTAPSVVIPDGFDAGEFSSLPPRGLFRKRYLNGHAGPLILFLARLNAKKGLDVLIDAMAVIAAERPDARLAVVGPADPPEFEGEVRRRIQTRRLESVIALTGRVDAETKLQAFSDSNIYVLPSQAENFGFSIFEAMASRIPVVVSDTLNYSREIEAEGAGYSVPRDASHFASAVLALIANPELCRRMGENGSILAQRYSIEDTAEKVEGAIVSILSGRQLPAELKPA